ncbi:phosphatase PAP2 family protein [Legionella drancourtii]|uniref:Inositolphosphotransferase Aur1/Ipt1 domain-containing protein n=1 Tax=Legionella drancourtii LLAP12 TaxID=658187 RepID=G9ETD4_9GAMM|nr:phosphatase PAP2 family protein [Legionella drancourtii]EHL29601.1 hypothetical protein LDG_8565 [Legionella drancourtii LLAP12]
MERLICALSFRQKKWFLVGGGLTVLIIGYYFISHAPIVPIVPIVHLHVDESIPFWPWTVWIYLIGLYFPIPYIIEKARSPETLVTALLATLCSGFVAFAFFWLVPMAYPRPSVISGGDAISNQLLAWVYLVDSPINTFPSLHVAYSTIFYLVIKEEVPSQRLFFFVNLCLILASTLTTKQHFLLDGIAGVLLALISFRAARALVSRPHFAKISLLFDKRSQVEPSNSP